jgi:hypothetical protein
MSGGAVISLAVDAGNNTMTGQRNLRCLTSALATLTMIVVLAAVAMAGDEANFA